MTQIQAIKIQLDGIGTSLKTLKLRVPPYQRSYSWEAEHVQALLSDLSDAIHSKEQEYFLGSIVVTGPDDMRYDVVDGQQRLTTISIIIAAIKDVFEESGDSQCATSIMTDYLSSTDRRTKEKEPRLSLNEIDNELYQELIESIPNTQNARFTRQSQKRLLDAATTIYSYFKDAYSKASDPEEELHTWLDYIESRLKIIIVTAPDDSNAFVIFETLNDRGLELAISDLLKNYLFHKSGDKIEETKHRWTSMIATLESASEEQLAVTFLRHYATSKYGSVREKDLFGTIKKKITNKKSALQFSTELNNAAVYYSALLNHESEIWDKFGDRIRQHIMSLNILGMIQIRPLLLSILDNFDIKNVQDAFRTLVAVAVRFQIVGGVGGGTLERVYGETAKEISDKKIKVASEISGKIRTLPNDYAFKAAFSSVSISKPALARFYLRCLEDYSSKYQSEMVPSNDVERVNLEHILPQTISKAWMNDWNADDAKAYYRRLGNLALMNTRINNSIGNDGFIAKAPYYKDSKFLLTQEVSTATTWNSNAIDERQLRFAELAVKLWAV